MLLRTPACSVILRAAVAVLGIINASSLFGQPYRPDVPNPVEAAWEKVDGMSVESLETFQKEFPGSVHSKDAKVLILLQKRMAAFRAKKEKPQFTISFQQMGDRWKECKRFESDRDILGFAFAEASFDPGVGLAGFRPLGKGSGTVTQTGRGPALPTKDGSIIAIKTYGMNTREVLRKLGGSDAFFGGFHFQTPDTTTAWPELDGTAFFGVIEGIGLVHIFGDVTVTSPEGRQTVLKEKQSQ